MPDGLMARLGADPVYDLACLSVYYPGLRPRSEELLGSTGITDADGAVRLRLHAQLFDSLNRLWEQAETLRQAWRNFNAPGNTNS